MKGPIRWMSPESIAKREYSPASDVWMFGILCVEVWTEKPPHADLDNFEGTNPISLATEKEESDFFFKA